MKKRGRPAPVHDPIVCTGCGESPKVRGNIVLPCLCGADWNFHLLDDGRRPKWLERLRS